MILVFILLTLAAFLAGSRYYEKNWSRSLSLQVIFRDQAVYAGEQTEAVEVIENRKKLPLPVMEAAFRLPKGVWFENAENIVISDYVYRRDIFAMRGMERVKRRYVLNCEKRGYYEVSQGILTGFSLFHRSRYELEQEISGELYVYAARTDVSELMEVCDTILGTEESSRRLYEDPFAFASIREYTPQDPMKNINWKATAKTGGLMVNTFASVCEVQFSVYLDVEDRNILRRTEETEKAVSAAATLCGRLLGKGLDVGLAINTRTPAVFPPLRGQEQRTRIEQFLTRDFEKEEAMDFGEMLESLSAARRLETGRDRNEDIRIAVFLSRQDTEENLRKAEAFLMPGQRGIWAAPCPPGEEKAFRIHPVGSGKARW